MKQIDTANDIFDSCRQVKKIFSNDMAAIVTGKSVANSLSDYLLILQKLFHSMDLLELYSERTETVISALDAAACSLTPDSIDNFISLYYDAVNSILLQLIRYREYYSVIRRNDPVPGLGSHIITNLGQIALSLSEGYLPVIDMENVTNGFGTLSHQINQNAWELFFRQPFDLHLEADTFSHNHILKDGIPALMPSYNMDFLTNSLQVNWWRKLVKSCMPFSPALEEKLTAACQNVPFCSGEKILGVLCRGTDYTSLRPYNHPVQPSITEVLAKAEEILHSHQCRYIYLATEDSDILTAFQDKFSDAVFTSQTMYFSDTEGSTLTSFIEKKSLNFYQKNEEYLVALYLLSRCQCFIGGRTSGSVVSLLLSDHFEYFYVWNKGRYGIDDTFCDLFLPPFSN